MSRYYQENSEDFEWFLEYIEYRRRIGLDKEYRELEEDLGIREVEHQKTEGFDFNEVFIEHE